MKALAVIFALLLHVQLICPGEPGSLPVAQVDAAAGATEPLAVVVNQTNPLTDITSEELLKVCRIEARHWPHGGKITLALREPGQQEREAVLHQLCSMTEAEFRQHSIAKEFKGEILSALKQLSSAAGVQRFVFHVPGAIGFVRLRDVDPSVKVLRVNGRLPSDASYSLKLTANSEVQKP